jgi:hypothetical protein
MDKGQMPLNMLDVLESTLETKEELYKEVCTWFENCLGGSTGEGTAAQWEKIRIEIDAQIKMLRFLIPACSLLSDISPDETPVCASDTSEGISFERVWKNAKENPPRDDRRYWCIVEECTELGVSHFQWNCYYSELRDVWSDDGKSYNVIWWTDLAPMPRTKNK